MDSNEEKFCYNTATRIISNNYAVQAVFDDIPETVLIKHLSKEDADESRRNKRGGYLVSHQVIECLAIVGIVPFNDGQAYIFNKPINQEWSKDNVVITSGVYEELMSCYLYSSDKISEKYLDKLKLEYYERGGILFPNYHSFEKLILNKDRSARNEVFIDSIVNDSILKHGLEEVGKIKWSSEGVTVFRDYIQRSYIDFPSRLQHTELSTSLVNRMFIGLVFGKYYKHINQLDDSSFGVVCTGSARYEFVYFEVVFK